MGVDSDRSSLGRWTWTLILFAWYELILSGERELMKIAFHCRNCFQSAKVNSEIPSPCLWGKSGYRQKVKQNLYFVLFVWLTSKYSACQSANLWVWFSEPQHLLSIMLKERKKEQERKEKEWRVEMEELSQVVPGSQGIIKGETRTRAEVTVD